MINKLTLGLLVGAASLHVAAQTATDIPAPSNNSYSQDSRGAITRSAYGLCWRSGYWTADAAIPGCDGALASPIPNPTAPEMANSLEKAPLPALATQQCRFTFMLESDQTFAFNQTILNSTAKQQIDHTVLPRLAACKTIAGLTITGHTDRLGSRQFNLTLSEKRAAAVASYLKTKGVETKITVRGAGEDEPILSCQEKSQAKLIACLAPNRRVLIDVQGL